MQGKKKMTVRILAGAAALLLSVSAPAVCLASASAAEPAANLAAADNTAATSERVAEEKDAGTQKTGDQKPAARSGKPVRLRVSNWEEYIDLGDWDEEETIELPSGDIIGENSMVEDFENWYYETYGIPVEVEYSTFGTT